MSQLTGDSRGRAVFIVTTTTFIAATVFVVARLLSRFAILKTRTADDWWMIVAWALAFGLSFTIDYGTERGLGRHDGDIPAGYLAPLRRSEYAFTILYNPALMATKTSILIFYLRMSRNTQKLLRMGSYVTLAIVLIAGTVLTLLNVFQCSPLSAAFNPLRTESKCISIVTLFLCSAPVNIFTDLAILVLPIPVLTGMQLPQKQKVILVGTFALGIFVAIVDVVRIYYLQQAVDYQIGISHERLGTGLDFAWNASTALMWSAVEVNVGIICACVPTLKPLIKRLVPSMIMDRARGRSSNKPDNSGNQSGSFSSQIRGENDNRRQSSIAAPLTSNQDLPSPLSPTDMEHEINMMDFLTTPDGGGTFNHAQIDHAMPQQAHHSDQNMDMMDFLTSPDLGPSSRRTHTTRTVTSANTVYFGFVNMKRPKSMLNTKGMESFKYCALVTTLFFLWGFSYGLLNTLNTEIGRIAGQSASQNLGLTSAYFGAYFLGAMTVGQWVLRTHGFKATFITGLCIYGTGTLMFWPSAVLTSFPGFIISNFVVGFGLSVLETAANPFLALCGPSNKAEFRLLLAQGVQAIASVLSQLLAEKVLFADFHTKPSLIDVQWTYLAIALFTVLLALFFYYMPLPEATDSDLQQQSADLGAYPTIPISKYRPKFINSLPVIYTTLALACFAQWIYVAAQESISVWFSTLLTALATSTSEPLTLTTSNYILVGHTTFVAGRFIFAFLTLVIQPRILLLVSFLGCLIFASLTMSLSHLNENQIAVPALILFFFEGPIFPLVYAIGLRGLGEKTKQGAAYLSAATSGGAIFPFVMYAVQEVDGKSVEYSFVVIVALFAFGLIFPLYLSGIENVRRQVDHRGENEGLPSGSENGRRGSCAGSGCGCGSGRSTPVRRLSHGIITVWGKIHPGGSGKKGGRGSADMGFVEHREGN